MPLTREQALQRLDQHTREQYSPPGTWWELELQDRVETFGRSAAEVRPNLKPCRVCPVVDLALAGGLPFLQLWALAHDSELHWRNIIEQLQPYTGLYVDECLVLVVHHDDGGEPAEKYVGVITEQEASLGTHS